MSTLSLLTTHLNNPAKVDPSRVSKDHYREAIESCSTYNNRIAAERKLRYPYLDTQTGIVHEKCRLWFSKDERLPAKNKQQVCSYPEIRWKKRKFMPLYDESKQFGMSNPELEEDHCKLEITNGESQNSISQDFLSIKKEDCNLENSHCIMNAFHSQKVASNQFIQNNSNFDSCGECPIVQEENTELFSFQENTYINNEFVSDIHDVMNKCYQEQNGSLEYSTDSLQSRFNVPVVQIDKPQSQSKSSPSHEDESKPNKLPFIEVEPISSDEEGNSNLGSEDHSLGGFEDASSSFHKMEYQMLDGLQESDYDEEEDDYEMSKSRNKRRRTGLTGRRRRRNNGTALGYGESFDERGLLCEACGKYFKNRAGLSYHFNRAHAQTPPMALTPDDASNGTPPTQLNTPTSNLAAPSPCSSSNLVDQSSPLTIPADDQQYNSNQLKEDEELSQTENQQSNGFCDFCLGTEAENKKTGKPEELIACSDCAHSGHPSCLQFTETMRSRVKQYNWQCLECKSCRQCGTSENDDQLLFCDDCDRGFHMYCLNPPLTEPPEGQWSCHLCIEELGMNKS